jgi:apolipoprotein N-acyltransferase
VPRGRDRRGDPAAGVAARVTLGRAAGLTVVSGVLCVLAFPPFGIFPLAFLALAPWFLAMRDVSVGRALLLSVLFWSIYFAGGLWWVTSVAGVPGLAILSAVLLLFGVPCGLVLRLAARSRWIPYPIAAAATFAATDFAREHLLTGFPWILLGHSQHPFLAFAQVADLGGVPLVTFLLALVAGLLVPVGGRVSAKRAAAAVAVVGAASLYGVVRMHAIALHDGPTLTAIQANVSPYEKHGQLEAVRILQKHVDLTDKALRAHPETDLVVWSETMYPHELDESGGDGSTAAELSALARRFGRAFLVGVITVDRGDRDDRSFEHREHNSAILVAKDGSRVARYDKIHLVPAGEYIPMRRYLPFRGTIETILFDMLHYFPNLTPGEEMVVMPLDTARGRCSFGALVCYETIFSGLAVDAARRGAQFLVQLSNEGWYYDSAEADQMEEMSAFRAIETRRPLFRATNTGISETVDPLGRIVARVEVNGRRKLVEGTLTSTLPLADAGSLYVAIGNAVAWALVAVCLVAAADGWRRAKSVTGATART